MTHEQWLDWWRTRAQTYFTDRVWSFSRPELIRRLSIQRDTPVLEIGFGYGRELLQFCTLSDHVYGVELDVWTVEEAGRTFRSKGVQNPPTVAVYDGTTLPFTAGVFGVVYSCFVTQHVSRSAAEDLLAEALRVCRPDGYVLFEYFGDPECQSDTSDVYSGNPDDGGMYNNAYSENQVRNLGARRGNVQWVEPWRITSEWWNWWLCVQPKTTLR